MDRRARSGGMRVAGTLILATALLAACSSAVPTPAATTPTSTSPSSSASSSATSTAAGSSTAGRTIQITVTGNTVAPPPARVDLPVGQTLSLVVTSDHDDQLHAHGFEVETDIKAGQPATVTLTGKDQGVFEVELHHPALTLLTVAVR